MNEVPLGPLAACDVFDKDVVVFDELHNKLCVRSGSSVKDYAVPAVYSSDLYFWAQVYFLTRNVLLCLLKSHKNRCYCIVTLLLVEGEGRCEIIRHLKTDVRSKGYRVQSHKAGSQIVFSINNGPQYSKWKRHHSDDRELFIRQVSEDVEYSSPILRSSSDVSPTSSDGVREGVLIIVRADAMGDVSGSVLSLGRSRLGVKLRRVNSVRHWRQTVVSKCMTRWPLEADEHLCPPVLCGAQAVFICRSDPSLAVVADTVTNPKKGILAAISNKLQGIETHAVANIHRMNISGLPPDTNHIWSNIDVLNGVPLLLTVAPVTGLCLLFELHQLSPGRLTWRHRELSVSLASPSLNSLFVRSFRDKTTSSCHLMIRGAIARDSVCKCFIEDVTFRL